MTGQILFKIQLQNLTAACFLFSGKPFTDLKEEMKHAYALYCKNYDDVTNLLEQVSLPSLSPVRNRVVSNKI